MKGGRVARIRLNPKDCMSIVDVLNRLDLHPSGMSFSQGVSIVLSSLLESLRQNNVIPRREFEFNEFMAMFPPDRLIDRGRKVDITNSMWGERLQVPPLVPETPEIRRRRLRYEELKFKRENDELNWTPELQEEFRPLVDEFFQ